MGKVAKGPGWELRLGRWQDVLEDVEECDAVITDPPYSERTERGQRSGAPPDADGWQDPEAGHIRYGHVTEDDARAIAQFAADRVSRWVVAFGDHITVPWYLGQLDTCGLYTFAPSVWTKTDAAPRFMCDGPSPTVEHIAIARPRRRLNRVEKRHRLGHYNGGTKSSGRVVTGGKPLWLMRAIVRDYSEPGDLIVDPCAGGGTTLLAAVIEGRRAIGAECDPETFALAVKRLKRGYTPCFNFEAPT